MPFEWISSGVGGGLAGVLAVVSTVMGIWAYRERGLRIAERDERIKELKADLKEQVEINRNHAVAANRIADVMEDWTPGAQKETIRRRLPGATGR